MKKYKIYAKGNYLVVVDTQKNEYFYGIRKEVHVDKSNVNTPSYRIFNVKDFSSNIILSVPNILKEDGTAYSEAEFDTFYQENTGNFNGGGSAPGLSDVTDVENITTENIGINVLSADYPLHIGAKLKEGDTEKVGLKLQNLLDEDFRRALVIQAGDTSNQRRYFEYLNHLGVRTNLLGFNANNDFIAFNSLLQYHYITAMAGDITSINSGGSGHVRINADPTPTGNQGMVIYDGTANPNPITNAMHLLTNAEIGARSGRQIKAYGSTNVNYTRLFTSGSKCHVHGQGLPLTFYSSANKIEIADSTTAVKATFDTLNGRLGLNVTNPTEVLEVSGNGKFSGDVEITGIILKDTILGTRHRITLVNGVLTVSLAI